MTKQTLFGAISDTGGAVLAEFAVALLTMIVAIFGVLDMGLFLWTDITLNRATHAAARCLAIADTAHCSDVASYAAAQSWAASDLKKNAQYGSGACLSGAGAQVTGTYTYSFITPGVGPSVTLSHTACYPKQS